MKDQIPAYLQLYIKLRNDIVNHVYPYQAKLPGKRTIAERNGLSLVTVEHALSLLEEEGYIEAKERSGFFTSYRDGYFASSGEERIQVRDTLPSLHDNEAFSAKIIAKSMRRILNDYPDEILQKTEGKGLPSLRLALANYLARSRNIHVNSEQIIIGSGSEYMYSLIVQLLGRSRIYAVEDPCYEKIRRIYQSNGVRIDRLTMGKHGILSEELERTPASILHITPYHSYPSGVTSNAAKRREYIEWAAKRKAILIEDDYDSEFTILSKPEDTLFSIEPTHTVIYLNTFSRTISPGIRASYMILPQSMIGLYEKEAGMNDCTVSTFTQILIADLLNSGEFERHINRVRRQRRRQMNRS